MFFALVFLVSFYSKAEIMSRAFEPIDDPAPLIKDGQIERNLNVLDSTTSLEIYLPVQAWGDRFWALDKGLIANRYADPLFLSEKTAKDKRNYILKHSAKSILIEPADLRDNHLDALSPAEKYDLLVGDDQMTLSEAQWAEVDKSQKAGTLADWNGICEGTAAASVYFPEPKHSVDLKTPAGVSLHFHIADIKALESLLWSAYNLYVPIIGTRCDSKTPAHDPQGIVTEKACFDVNPGAWHIALLNFIGRRKQVLFINRSNEAQVWNVPVLSYRMKYFKPGLAISSGLFSDSIIKIKDDVKDKYRAYRSPLAESLVGVSMSIDIATGFVDDRDFTGKAKVTTMNFSYDLELDSKGMIVGGEWLESIHPDFMWAVSSPGFIPLSSGDLKLAGQNWAGGLVSKDWLPAIQLSSQKNQPLEIIIQKLVELSQ
jgi:hypothetical protein